MAKAKKTKSTAKSKATTKAAAGKSKVGPPNLGHAFEQLGKLKANPKAKPKKATPKELAAFALAGDVEALVVALEPFNNDGENDVELYKWLEVASDFGPTAKHRKAADDLMDTIQEAGALRYDDDQIETGGTHWELGVAYLTAGEHLPRDLERAKAQLAMAKERYFPWSIQGAEAMIKKTRKALDADALAVFDTIYDGTKPAQSAGGSGDDDYDE